MPEQVAGIVVAGAGHAGGSAAAFLRQYGWQGPITLVGEEALPPYQRPPLSKAWLKGEADGAGLALRPVAFYAKQDIALRLSTRILALDRAGQRLLLADGGAVPYDRLILALGASPRRLSLPGCALEGVLELRTTLDADRIKAALGPGVRLAVIGGGYIGLEVAASARALGAEAVVIEREARVLARVASAELSAYVTEQHRAQGVTILCGADVEGLEGQAGRVAGIRLRDGALISCDVALIGVGAVPNDGLAREAGLAVAGGILVDERARTEDALIHAIGDCTVRPVPLYGRKLRLESVPNAIEQAKQAAADLCGRAQPAPEVPWFWSDQYVLRIQIAGLLHEVARTVARRDPATGGVAFFHLAADGCVQAVEAVSASAEFMAGRQMIAKRLPVAAEALADPARAMRELIPS